MTELEGKFLTFFFQMSRQFSYPLCWKLSCLCPSSLSASFLPILSPWSSSFSLWGRTSASEGQLWSCVKELQDHFWQHFSLYWIHGKRSQNTQPFLRREIIDMKYLSWLLLWFLCQPLVVRAAVFSDYPWLTFSWEKPSPFFSGLLAAVSSCLSWSPVQGPWRLLVWEQNSAKPHLKDKPF